MNRYQSLMDQIATLEQQAATILKEERAKALSEIKQTMQVHGISVDDLRGKRGPRKKAAP